MIDIAIRGVTRRGAGTLVVNLENDSTTYMSGSDVEGDILVAESERDEEVLKFLRDVMEEIDNNDWSKNVLVTLISNAGTRTFALEAGRSQESLRRSQKVWISSSIWLKATAVSAAVHY